MMTTATILEHIIDPQRADLSQDLAHYVLSLGFTPADQARYAELAGKAPEGTLTTEEQWELDQFLSVNDFLTIIQAKARLSLQNQNITAA